MNKHTVFFSVLLASAVSLHTLSYALEQNPEIVKQVKSEKKEASENMTANKIKKVKKTEINKAPVNTEFKKEQPETKEEKRLPDNIVQANTTVLSAFIPSKNHIEIVREAKIIGGRVDPFLSMKPPELEKVPEIKLHQFSNESGIALHPEFSLSKTTKTEAKLNIKKPVRFAVKPNTSLTKETRSDTEKENIEIHKIQEGIILNGIITGSKPLALLSVDNTSNVFGIGDLIRKSKNIKIVSIDIETEAITISDDKNRKAKITIQ